MSSRPIFGKRCPGTSTARRKPFRRARIAWIVAGAGWMCAVAASVALALMMPLKTVEPYVIRVDNSTGIVDIVPMYAGHAEMGETVARFLLTHYVTVCEGFSYATAERDYEECGAYHSAKRNHGVVQPLESDESRITLEPQQGRLGRSRASHGGDLLPQGQWHSRNWPKCATSKADSLPGAAEQLTHWIATIEYAWVTPSRDPKSRQWNPLGWRVTDFHTEPESLADTSTVAAPNR